MRTPFLFEIFIAVGFASCSTSEEPIDEMIEIGYKQDNLETLSVEDLIADQGLLNKVVKVNGVYTSDGICSDDLQSKVGFMTVSSVMQWDQLWKLYNKPLGSRITVIGKYENEMYEDSEYYPDGHLVDVSYIKYPSTHKDEQPAK